MNPNRKDPFAFEAPSHAPKSAGSAETTPAEPEAAEESAPEAESEERPTTLTPEAYERLPEELKAAIQARKERAQQMTEAFERGFRKRLVKGACAGAVLSMALCYFLPVTSILIFIFMAAQGAASGYWIVLREATSLGGVLRYGCSAVGTTLFGFVTGILNWQGAGIAFLAWLVYCSTGSLLAMWAKSDRDKYNAF